MAIYKFDKLIVENVKDKNPEDSYRRTPFYYAIKKGHSLVANFVESNWLWKAYNVKARKMDD